MIIKVMKVETTVNGSDTFIERLETIVLANLTREDFDVETFAEIAGSSRSALYRKIKHATGKSVTQFIRDIRLKKAVELLQNNELTAAEVAYEVGFHSATYFSKCFKETYGFTPGETEFHQQDVYQILHRDADSPKEGWFNMQLVYFPVLLVALIIIGGTVIWMTWGTNRNNNYQRSSMPIPVESEGETIHAAANRSIAILPLNNWTGDPAKDYMGSGLAHDIISIVSKMNSIGRVAPMISVIPYKDSIPNIKKLSKDLDVEFLVWGGIQKAEDFYKFSVEIINAEEDSLYWSKVYVIDYKNTESYYLMEADIADQIASLIGGVQFKMFSRDAPTTSSKARNYYFQGIQKSIILTREAWESSITLFNKAIEEDPVYVDAYEALAKTWGFGGMNWGYTSQQEAWTNMKYYLRKILDIDPEHKTAPYFLKDGYFYYELDITPEIPEINQIPIENMIVFNADFAGKLGRHRKAIEGNMIWLKNEPYAGTIYALLAINHYFLGDREKAKTLLTENYEIYKTDLDFLRESAKAWYFLGDYNRMEKSVDYFFENFEERPLIMRWLRAIAADQKGDTVVVNNQLHILHQSYQKSTSGSPAWFIALFHAYKGDKDKTIEWLEKSYAARETEMTWLAQEPDLKILGNSPRYLALLDSMHFPESARAHVIQPDKFNN